MGQCLLVHAVARVADRQLGVGSGRHCSRLPGISALDVALRQSDINFAYTLSDGVGGITDDVHEHALNL